MGSTGGGVLEGKGIQEAGSYLYYCSGELMLPMEEGKRALGQHFVASKVHEEYWGNGQLDNFWSPGSNTTLGAAIYSHIIGSRPNVIRSQAQILLQA